MAIEIAPTASRWVSNKRWNRRQKPNTQPIYTQRHPDRPLLIHVSQKHSQQTHINRLKSITIESLIWQGMTLSFVPGDYVYMTP